MAYVAEEKKNHFVKPFHKEVSSKAILCNNLDARLSPCFEEEVHS